MSVYAPRCGGGESKWLLCKVLPPSINTPRGAPAAPAGGRASSADGASRARGREAIVCVARAALGASGRALPTAPEHRRGRAPQRSGGTEGEPAMSIADRFQGEVGRARLLDALSRQKLVAGDERLAQALAGASQIRGYASGDRLIEEGATDNHLVLLLAGSVNVLVRGSVLATRTAGDHVGEMALIEPALPRSASVVATDDVAVAEIAEADFVKVADQFPGVWRPLAAELSRRLYQRGRLLRVPNQRPRLFVGSSGEALQVAREVELALDHDPIDVVLWTNQVFGATQFPVEALEAQLERADFALLVLSADDRLRSRGTEQDAPRDNVVFELGLFMGALGRERSLMLAPRGARLRIPSDLLGLTPVEFDASASLTTALSPACTRIRMHINRVGVR